MDLWRGGRRLRTAACAPKAAEARQARGSFFKAGDRAALQRPGALAAAFSAPAIERRPPRRCARSGLIGASYRVLQPGALSTAAARRALRCFLKTIS